MTVGEQRQVGGVVGHPGRVCRDTLVGSSVRTVFHASLMSRASGGKGPRETATVKKERTSTSFSSQHSRLHLTGGPHNAIYIETAGQAHAQHVPSAAPPGTMSCTCKKFYTAHVQYARLCTAVPNNAHSNSVVSSRKDNTGQGWRCSHWEGEK